jgi:hypothetical protein
MEFDEVLKVTKFPIEDPFSTKFQVCAINMSIIDFRHQDRQI